MLIPQIAIDWRGSWRLIDESIIENEDIATVVAVQCVVSDQYIG